MAQISDQKDFLKTALRLPRDLHARIQEAAEASGRSMNAEILARLATSFEQADLSALKLVGRIGDKPSVIDDVARALEELQTIRTTVESSPETPTPISEVVAQIKRNLEESAARAREVADEMQSLRRMELPPGTPFRNDPFALLRPLLRLAEEGHKEDAKRRLLIKKPLRPSVPPQPVATRRIRIRKHKP